MLADFATVSRKAGRLIRRDDPSNKIVDHFEKIVGLNLSPGQAGPLETVELLGEGSYCSWSSDEEMGVYLGNGATINP